MNQESYLDDDTLNTIIKLYGRKIIENSFFGQLKYNMSNPHPYSWKGSIYFDPTQEQVGLYVQGNRDQIPMEKELEFYRKIESSYRGLMRLIADEDLLVYMKTINADFQQENVWKTFKLEAIWMSRNMGSNNAWALDYSCSLNLQRYSILMIDWRKRGLWVDGFPKTQIF